MNKFKKQLLTVVTIFSLLVSSVTPAWAQEAPPAPPGAPSAPTAPSQPTPPPAPTPPSAPSEPTPPPNPNTNPTPTPQASSAPASPTPTPQASASPQASPSSSSSPQPTPTPSASSQTQPTPPPGNANTSGDVTNNDQNGGATINTGDANSSAVLSTDANANLAATLAGSGSGASIVNDGNGTNSQNSGSAVLTDTNNTVQNNTANVVNDLNQASISGQNSASSNTNGDVSITTGDSNVSGTLITAVNTNLAGVAVSEFNIEDDHVGDIVLDFAANCIMGCGGGGSVTNSGNGADSTNDGSLVQVIDNGTFQNNDANIDNSLTLAADSGHNNGDRNTGGDVAIDTGNANVSANALTLANNNISGQVLYGVVNIYGDLVGDIIFPEEMLNSCCGGNASVANTGNGSDSTNTGSVSQTTNNSTTQTNIAAIDNNLDMAATSGDNYAGRNTGGNVDVTTGNTSVDAQVLNVANSNVDGVWWLVLVNEAGNWIGRIMGSPDGANFAGSEGSEFAVNDQGEITVVNSSNGDGSQNNGSVSQTTNNTTVQNNNLTLSNNLNLSANTGENSASRNTGGDVSIETGDARIVANLVNFVNNNISGGGRLVVTVVNVFGSWLGNFVGPGQHQDNSSAQNQAAVGGAEANTAQNSTPSTNVGGSTTNPTPTPTPRVNVLAAITTTSQASPTPDFSGYDGNADQIDESVQVAGYFTESDASGLDVVAGKKSIRINLAWLLLILPMGGIFFIIRKKLLVQTAR